MFVVDDFENPLCKTENGPQCCRLKTEHRIYRNQKLVKEMLGIDCRAALPLARKDLEA